MASPPLRIKTPKYRVQGYEKEEEDDDGYISSVEEGFVVGAPIARRGAAAAAAAAANQKRAVVEALFYTVGAIGLSYLIYGPIVAKYIAALILLGAFVQCTRHLPSV